MKYRADIDGLRAFAIIPVVLYHAGITMFSGGYVGVDIFFVISGYLITSIILNDINKDKFTITSFYFRRIKRIFPALYFFFIVTSIFCWFFYMPADLKAYGKSLFGSVFFISNIVFWRESGYFAAASELKPLLHTWSLSVEEQFYIFFPVMMIILAKYFRKKYIPAVLFIFVSSFILSIWATPKMPSASFFLLPTRAWELMLGCLLALGFFPKTENIKALNLLSLAGIIMIFVSIFAYEQTTPFPGYAALLPCFGTALIIYSGSFAADISARPLINKFIAWKPFVLIGLVSYSWYLWHWSVFAFRNYYDFVTVDMLIKSNWILIPFTLLMAIVSYFLVEKPFRDIKWENRYKLFAYSAAVMVLFAGFGLLVYKKDGFSQRISEKASVYSFGKDDKKGFRDKKFHSIGNVDKEASFILWGDSHAMAVASGIDMLAKNTNKAGLLINYGGCPPIFSVAKKGRAACVNFNEHILDDIIAKNIKNVIIAASWSDYTISPLMTGSTNTYSVNGNNITKREDKIKLITEGLNYTIAKLNGAGIKVSILLSVPVYNYNIPDTLSKLVFIESRFPEVAMNNLSDFTLSDLTLQRADIANVFDIIKGEGINFVDLAEPLCRSGLCEVKNKDNRTYYFDAGHLSVTGAKFVCEELRDEVVPFL